jgi:hypothetical protein
MNDGMIVSRLIINVPCNPELVRKLPQRGRRKGSPVFCVFETTASRGDRAARVLCCWSGGRVDTEKGPVFTPIGACAFDALMRLPLCMGEHPALDVVPVIREIRMGRTPLRDKVIDAILEAPPGARLCFLGDLAGELDGQMNLAFNILDGEPIVLDDEGRPV